MEPKTSETIENMGTALIARSGELAISAAAARAKAEAEAGYIVALKNPRNIDDARQEILAACKRERFAESAKFVKKVGNQEISGPSIRFAETAIQAMRNIRSSSTITYEDDNIRCLHITVTDFEKNISYGKDVTLNKTVERRDKKGREIISERKNTYGDTVYIVRATEDELQNKTAAAESKIIRNAGLRLVPQDLIEEAMDECSNTLARGNADPTAARKRVCDAFATIGVKPSDLEKYLGHPIDQTGPKEWETLRGIYAAIRDGESKWADYVEPSGKHVAKGVIDLNDLKPTPSQEQPKADPNLPGQAQLLKELFNDRCILHKLKPARREEALAAIFMEIGVYDWPEVDTEDKLSKAIAKMDTFLPSKG